MDIQRKCFEESNNVNPDWSFKFDEELQQYIALDSEMELQVDEFNEHWDTFRAGWQAAKAHEAKKLEGCVMVPVKSCKWTKDEDSSWWTECGEGFVFNDDPHPHNHNFKNCCFCGGLLEAARGGNE